MRSTATDDACDWSSNVTRVPTHVQKIQGLLVL